MTELYQSQFQYRIIINIGYTSGEMVYLSKWIKIINFSVMISSGGNPRIDQVKYGYPYSHLLSK